MATLSQGAGTVSLQPSEPYANEVLSGSGACMQRLRMQLTRIAPHFRIALVLGERGVGKEAVSRELHRLSPVADRPCRVQELEVFALNAEASADHATIVLRGLDHADQRTLERLWQRLLTLPRETRVVLTSEREPKGMLAAGRIRPDLYAKVGMLEIRIPPLRERTEDLAGIACSMLNRTGSRGTLPAHTVLALQRYRWPKNLEELWQALVVVSHLEGEIQPEDLPVLSQVGADQLTVARLDEVIERHVLDVLQLCAGNKLKTAELLGISRSTLYRMLDSVPL